MLPFTRIDMKVSTVAGAGENPLSPAVVGLITPLTRVCMD